VASVSTVTDRTSPRPPRYRPSPPLSGRSAYLSTSSGYSASKRPDRRVERVRHADVDAAHPVAGRPSAVAAADRLVVGEPLTARADREVVHRPLTASRHPVRRGLGQRPEGHVGDALARLNVAAHDRGRWLGVQQRPLGYPNVDRIVAAGVRRNLGIGHAAHDQVDGAFRHRERRVHVAGDLVGGTPEVDRQFGPGDGHRRLDRDVVVGDAVALHHVAGGVLPVGKLPELCGHAIPGVRLHGVERGQQPPAAVVG
jgi:hypothetical protein